jgi:hypothetical protein
MGNASTNPTSTPSVEIEKIRADYRKLEQSFEELKVYKKILDMEAFRAIIPTKEYTTQLEELYPKDIAKNDHMVQEFKFYTKSFMGRQT